MYLSFGATGTLAPIGKCYRTVWYVGGAAIIYEGACVLVHARSIASHKTGGYTLLFRDKGEDRAAPLTIIKGRILQTA